MRRDRLKDYINSEPEFEEIFSCCAKCKKKFLAIYLETKIRQYRSKRTISSFYNKNDNPKFRDKISFTYNRTFRRFIITESISFYGD